MRTETDALMLSAGMALFLGVTGLVLSVITGSQVILLDGLFNLIYSVMAFLSVRVARLLAMPDNEKYPFGHAYFESLVNAAKGLLILGISLLALGDSVLVLLSGGREIVAGLAILYSVIATTSSIMTFVLLRRARRHTTSPLVEADFANWWINTVISASVLLAFCLIPLAEAVGFSVITPYVDPLMVATVVVLFCLSTPFRMASDAIKELLNRAPPKHVRQPVHDVVEAVVEEWGAQDFSLRMVRPGRTLYLLVHVVLPAASDNGTLGQQDRIRTDLDGRLRRIVPSLVLDVVFTADPRWAAPTNGHEPA
ncbi:cation diffusion facilitator family transporter [uncultured Halovibrio sp.]|uniref:cation diffusion facilitator family transporter n=1 Tax=uncultured Halovibrio sp. TaxID=985049 RepID=UPI0025E33272|nr:cation diffusion facilitator family transporter [uncultured Halovibrio sp.]